MGEYDFIIDRMEFSFSRLNTYSNCPYEWYLRYIEENRDGVKNIYAEFGSLCHSILEKYAKGEYKKAALSNIYDKRFTNEIEDYTTTESEIVLGLYEKGKTYFDNNVFDIPLFDELEIIGVEQKCKFTIDGVGKFIGYIDLLVRDKGNNLIIIDHKSADSPIGKKGGVLKSKQEKFIEFKRQLYLYSLWVKETYGTYPIKLMWNHFKSGSWVTVDFSEEELQDSINWAKSMLTTIRGDGFFSPTPSFIYCSKLCQYRDGICEFKGGA